MAAGKRQQPRKQRSHWRWKQGPSGSEDTGSGGRGNTRTTMTATTGDKDYGLCIMSLSTNATGMAMTITATTTATFMTMTIMTMTMATRAGTVAVLKTEPAAAAAVVATVGADNNQQRAEKMVAAAIAVGKRHQAEERSMPTVMTKYGDGGGGGGDGSGEWPEVRVKIGAYLAQSRTMFLANVFLKRSQCLASRQSSICATVRYICLRKMVILYVYLRICTKRTQFTEQIRRKKLRSICVSVYFLKKS